MEKAHDNWEDFVACIPGLRKPYENSDRQVGGHVSSTLFRGQSKSQWKLETTLERYTNKRYTVRSYLGMMLGVNRIVESFTDRDWGIVCSDPWREEIKTAQTPPFYEFMVYLRHHGFPSPLLDWSRSPYVAAFFAFRDALPAPDTHVAIYSYIEYTGGGHSYVASEPHINGLGPYIKTHKRHHLQQGEYTICRRRDGDNYYYWPHDDALTDNHRWQDVCTKHLIPTKEKSKVLQLLQSMNVNDFSLFGTEEGLMQMVAFNEIDDKRNF